MHGGRSAFVGIGANLGDARATVQAAVAALAGLAGSRLHRCSPVYRSAPVDATGPEFFNAVAEIETALPAQALLAELHAIERAFGRQRPYANAPRTLDLDLLLVGDERHDTPTLRLPHPRLHLRAFVLRPLLDLAPELAAPGLGRLADWLPATAGQAIDAVDAAPPQGPAAP